MGGRPSRSVWRVNRKALRQKPQRAPNNSSVADVERLLLLSGWIFERQRGSHAFYRKGALRLSVPVRRGATLAAYVREVLERTREESDADP